MEPEAFFAKILTLGLSLKLLSFLLFRLFLGLIAGFAETDLQFGAALALILSLELLVVKLTILTPGFFERLVIELV